MNCVIRWQNTNNKKLFVVFRTNIFLLIVSIDWEELRRPYTKNIHKRGIIVNY